MRTTVTLDDQLLGEATELTGITDRSALIREALTRLIQSENSRRLGRLGGSEPNLVQPPRRRFG